MVQYLATEVRWQDRRFHVPVERIQLSEELGYDAVFTAEGLGSDAFTPLGYIAAHTTRRTLGTRILQVSERSPSASARGLMTLDHLAAGGRVIGGFGGTRTDRPVAATGPQMVRLGAEVGDGWMPSFFTPGTLPAFRPLLEAGFARGGRSATDDFQVWAHVDMLVDDDVRAAMRPFKEYTAMWSAMQRPFIEARGYMEMAERLAELVPAGRMDEAIDAIPDEYIDDGWLVGPVDRIRTRAIPWLESEATGLVFRYGPQVGVDRSGQSENLDAFRAVAEAAGRATRA